MPRKHIVKHGTWAEYNRYGCRCDPCKRACTDHKAEVLQRARARLEDGVFTGRHGTMYAVQAGCRCEACEARRKAQIDTDRAAREKRRTHRDPNEWVGRWDETQGLTVVHWPRWDGNGRWTCPHCGQQFEVASATPQRNAA